MGPSVTLEPACLSRALMVGSEKPRSSAVDPNERRRPCDVMPGSASATPLSHRVKPVWCLSSLVTDGKTYLESESADASVMTAKAAAPIGLMLFPVLVRCKRSTMRVVSTSAFNNPSISLRRHPVRAAARTAMTGCQLPPLLRAPRPRLRPRRRRGLPRRPPASLARHDKMRVEMEDAYVLINKKMLSSLNELLPLLFSPASAPYSSCRQLSSALNTVPGTLTRLSQ
jgi:hypothetical protein